MAAGKSAEGNNPKFDEVGDTHMIGRVLEAIRDHHLPMTLWLKSQIIKFEARIVYYASGGAHILLKLPEDVDRATFEQAVRAQGSDEIFGSFRADAINFFFRTTVVLGTDPTHVEILVPPKLFKLQRRLNVRIPFSRADAPVVTLPPTLPGKKPDAFRVLDLSAGGLAIAAPVEKKHLFKDGEKLPDLRFSVRGTLIVTGGKIRHVQEVLNDKRQPMLRVGIMFDGLPPTCEKILAQFALDESRRLFSLLY